MDRRALAGSRGVVGENGRGPALCPIPPALWDDVGGLSLSDELSQFPRMMTQSWSLCSCLGFGG